MEQPIQVGQPSNLKHSGLGIASFIISILSGIMFCLVVGGAALLQVSTSGAIRSNATVMSILGLLIIVLFLACLVALGLGISALFQKNRKKIFGILGVIFSIAVIISWIALETIGLSSL